MYIARNSQAVLDILPCRKLDFFLPECRGIELLSIYLICIYVGAMGLDDHEDQAHSEARAELSEKHRVKEQQKRKEKLEREKKVIHEQREVERQKIREKYQLPSERKTASKSGSSKKESGKDDKNCCVS